MSFLNRILDPPRYGYQKDNKLYVPSHKEIFSEFFFRTNPFSTRKNWLPFFGWFSSSILAVPFFIFFIFYFSWPLFLFAFLYSMVILGTHGTIWYHRYSTHRAYKFKNPIWRFFVKNLVVKLIPDETYVISHHVHHAISEAPGDPYNVHAGWLYCFLADAIHQPIAKDLSETEYRQVAKFLDHTGVRINSYTQYQKWGSLCHPLTTVIHFSLNWIFWYGVAYLIGGHGLATATFAASGFWAFGVRTFNFSGHGSGKDLRKVGIDFNRKDLSINQLWPGLVTGEWHNNHHLYPNGARAGFQAYQLDYAWWFIKSLYLLGGITSYRDDKEDFLQKYYLPYKRSLLNPKVPAILPT